MGVYKPVKGADGQFVRNSDGSLQMAATRRDPTTEEVRSVMRQQHIIQTRQRMQQSGESRPYFEPAPAVAPPPTPPPTAEQMAASQTPLPQAQPPLPPAVQAGLEAIAPPVGTIDEEIEKAKSSEPRKAAEKAVKKTRKAGKQRNLPRRKCAWESCDKGPGGLQKVFQPYRKYDKYCCSECRDSARKKKAKDKYHAKKKAKAAKSAE